MNGKFWLRVVGIVLAALLATVVTASAGILWGLNGRVTRNETAVENTQERLDRIEQKLDTLIARGGS